jgi:hypothetical protein
MWGAIKKALNSTLGTKQFSALDILAKKNTYNYFYNEWFGKNSTYSNEPKIYPITNEKKLNLEVGDSGRPLVVLPPEVEEIEQPLDSSYYRLPTCFLPYGIKELNCSIEFDLEYGFLCYFPETIEEISENAFAYLKSTDKIVINKKKDDLSGHPWGHPAEDDGIIYIG